MKETLRFAQAIDREVKMVRDRAVSFGQQYVSQCLVAHELESEMAVEHDLVQSDEDGQSTPGNAPKARLPRRIDGTHIPPCFAPEAIIIALAQFAIPQQLEHGRDVAEEPEPVVGAPRVLRQHLSSPQ